MFPLAHLYIAEKYFKELTNEIRFGSVLPDFLTISPNFSIFESHISIVNFEPEQFCSAWNLHIELDEYSEQKYFYPLIPIEIKQDLGEYLGHIFMETAFDYILFDKKIYFDPPILDEKILNTLELYFNKDLTLIKPTLQLFLTWERDSYKDNLAYSLMYICGVNEHVLTKSQVNQIISVCKKSLPDFKLLLDDFLSIFKNFKFYNRFFTN